ncbi:alcohol dehydrogenase catalytic domain-containing protein [Streptomyces sp. CA-179760]|uniref:alcohol dehydrogenase catalytic domain-containing protein n=1 Tax=Streptomyces sp. CA-179760 TaxID=3240054 RepID=UPI003D8EB41D
MRAAVYRSLGGPDVVEVAEVDKPVPGLAETRIKVQAAALNPADAAAWSGSFPAPPEGTAYGLGWDVAGVVDAVGPGSHWTPGQPVIAFSHGVPLGLNRGRPSTSLFLPRRSPRHLRVSNPSTPPPSLSTV